MIRNNFLFMCCTLAVKKLWLFQFTLFKFTLLNFFVFHSIHFLHLASSFSLSFSRFHSIPLKNPNDVRLKYLCFVFFRFQFNFKFLRYILILDIRIIEIYSDFHPSLYGLICFDCISLKNVFKKVQQYLVYKI